MELDTPFFSSDLSPTTNQKNALSVSELNQYIQMLLEGNPVLRSVWIKGEISNFTNHRSGHLYFSLKDENGIVRVVMFRNNVERLGFLPEEGMKVLLHGRVTLYGKTGQYQINADGIQPDGIGALYVAFEQLKTKLEREGLFSEEQKKTIPRYPKKIGIITSPTGAAIRDIIEITGRRFPLSELILYPALVQGSGAPSSLCSGIHYFEHAKEQGSADAVDVIILGRGGGSIEDLWGFNDERLARTIAAATIPIISAVGHETDFTIADFVADLRAPTPSAAAELAVPDATLLSRQIGNLNRHFQNLILSQIDRKRSKLQILLTSRALSSPSHSVEEKRLHLDHLSDRLAGASHHRIENQKTALRYIADRLHALNPLMVLGRGYTAVCHDDGRICTSASDLCVGDRISLRFKDGIHHAKIISAPGKQSE